MRLKQLMIANTIVEVGFGLGVLLIPTRLAETVGASLSEPEGLIYARLFGAALISLGVVTWLARNADDSDARRAIISALLLYNIVAVVVLVLAQVNGMRGAWGWSVVVLHVLLAIGFARFRFGG